MWKPSNLKRDDIVKLIFRIFRFKAPDINKVVTDVSLNMYPLSSVLHWKHFLHMEGNGRSRKEMPQEGIFYTRYWF